MTLKQIFKMVEQANQASNFAHSWSTIEFIVEAQFSFTQYPVRVNTLAEYHKFVNDEIVDNLANKFSDNNLQFEYFEATNKFIAKVEYFDTFHGKLDIEQITLAIVIIED